MLSLSTTEQDIHCYLYQFNAYIFMLYSIHNSAQQTLKMDGRLIFSMYLYKSKYRVKFLELIYRTDIYKLYMYIVMDVSLLHFNIDAKQFPKSLY